MAKKKETDKRGVMVRLMSKHQVTEREFMLAVLVAWGVPAGDAFGALMECKPEYREQMWQRYKNDKSNLGTMELIRELSDGPVADSGGFSYDLKSKEGMIDALSEQVKNADDPKQRADILMKIADLQRMKQDENTEKEKLVHYYLPLRCEECPWKNDNNGRGIGSATTDVE